MDPTQLSKLLSMVLRHKGIELGFSVSSDGYVLVSELLKNKKFSRYTIEDIKNVVETSNKKRFQLEEGPDGMLRIRAVQGHSMPTISDNLLLTLITDPSELPLILHGTYKKFLPNILAEGLSKMGRNHIHFAVGTDALSGFRKDCEVLILIDIHKAMAAGIQFQRSENGVILSRGINDTGIIPPEFFKEIRHMY